MQSASRVPVNVYQCESRTAGAEAAIAHSAVQPHVEAASVYNMIIIRFESYNNDDKFIC